MIFSWRYSNRMDYMLTVRAPCSGHRNVFTQAGSTAWFCAETKKKGSGGRPESDCSLMLAPAPVSISEANVVLLLVVFACTKIHGEANHPTMRVSATTITTPYTSSTLFSGYSVFYRSHAPNNNLRNARQKPLYSPAKQYYNYFYYYPISTSYFPERHDHELSNVA